MEEEPMISLRPGGFGFGFGMGAPKSTTAFPSSSVQTKGSQGSSNVPSRMAMESMMPIKGGDMGTSSGFSSGPRLSAAISKIELDMDTPDSFTTVEDKCIYNRQFMFKFQQENTDVPESLEAALVDIPELARDSSRVKMRPQAIHRPIRPVRPATTFPITKGTQPQSALAQRRAPDRWEPRLSFVKDEKEEVLRDVRGTLNKITPEKFEELTTTLCEAIGSITKEDVYREAVSLVFAKAVGEPNFSKMYAEMCVRLSVQPVLIPNSTITFRQVLLNNCQVEFEAAYQSVVESLPQGSDDDGLAKEKVRRRKLGNVKFIGELFKSHLVSEKIIHECIQILVGSIVDDGDKEIIENHCELTCKLMTTIGKLIDVPKAKDKMDQYFLRFKQMEQDHARFASRIRFMFKDLLELRQMKWIPRREESTPKTFDEVEADALAKEMQVKYGLVPTPVPAETSATEVKDTTPSGKKARKKKKKTKEAVKAEPPKKMTEEEIEAKTEELLTEYFTSQDIKEVARGLKELNAPQYRAKMVEKAVCMGVEKQEKDREYLVKLFNALFDENLISEEDFMKGFRAVAESLEDLELDTPQAATMIGKMLGHITVAGCVSLTVAEKIKDKIKKPMMEVINKS